MAESFHPWPIARMAKYALLALIICILIFYYRDNLRNLTLPAIAAVAMLALAASLVAFIRSRFETITLDEKTISHTLGVLTTKRVIVPYDKVTEAKYFQSILHRILGVGSLRVDSAGGDGIAITMDGVRKPDLDRIIAAINEHSHGPKGD